MEPLVLDRERLDQLLEAACAVLPGDWVLLGGAVAAICFSPHRVTEDIDLVPLGGADSRRYELMDFALAQGLPLEAVNSAADFFLRREEGFVEDLELLREGASGRIFRPSPTLFLVLKSTRMTESDLADCLAQVASARETRQTIDVPRVLARLARADEHDQTGTLEMHAGARARRQRLRADLCDPG